jgi:predicted deacetylase
LVALSDWRRAAYWAVTMVVKTVDEMAAKWVFQTVDWSVEWMVAR